MYGMIMSMFGQIPSLSSGYLPLQLNTKLIKMSISSIWSRITNLGLNKSDLGREVIKIRLLNQLIFLSLFTSTVVLIGYIIGQERQIFVLTTLVNIVIESAALFLSSRKKFKWARFTAVILFPTWMGINLMLNGGGFGESNIFIALAFVAFILYEDEKKYQFPAAFFISSIFVFSKFYVIENGLVNEASSSSPYDEILTYPAILTALGLIFYLYQKEISNFEEEQKKWLADMAEQNKKLNKSNESLKQFNFIASHDLKEPIRIIGGFTNLLERKIKEDEKEAQEYIGFIKDNNETLEQLVESLGKYTEILTKQKMEISTTSIDYIFDSLYAHFEHSKLKGKVDITFANHSSKKEITTGREELLLILKQLISNGIKFNKSEQPKIKVEFQETKEKLLFSVEDNGLGIDPEYLKYIFKPFKTLQNKSVAKTAGLGLAICENLAHYLGGKIWAESNPKKGSIFFIELKEYNEVQTLDTSKRTHQLSQ